MDIVEGSRAYQWHADVPADEFLGSAPTMLSVGEQKMLHWIAKNQDFSDGGCIVDAGCFLGGSTLALATGASKNIGYRRPRIHSYDMFLAPIHGPSLDLIGHGRGPGASVLDLFEQGLGVYRDYVDVHQGDILDAPAPESPISLLFVDVCKSRDINAKIIGDYFPKLTPGLSVVIQQDQNDHYCSWINASMVFLSEYFDVLADESGCRLYLNTKRIPLSVIAQAASLGPADEIRLLKQQVQSETHPFARFFSAVTMAWPIFETAGVEAAVAHLRALDVPQPWESDQPYVERVIVDLLHLGTPAALLEQTKDYFGRAVAA